MIGIYVISFDKLLYLKYSWITLLFTVVFIASKNLHYANDYNYGVNDAGEFHLLLIGKDSRGFLLSLWI